MKRIGLFIASVLLSACAATDMSHSLKQGVVAIPKEPIGLTVDQIKQLKPQAKPPLKVALVNANKGYYEAGFAPEEMRVIQDWARRFKELGFIERLDVVPQSMLGSCGNSSDINCERNQARLAGASLGADAILFLSGNAVTDSYANPLSFLNMTVVGMWIVPAHHRDSYAVYDAALFDINNNYLFGFAEEYGEAKSILPFIYAERNTGKLDAKVEALNKVGQALYDKVKGQMAAH
jgi:rhombotail lipoprotein